MARVIGGLTTSHIPAIGNAIARELFDDPYWKPFFDGYPPVREWLADVQPDIAVVVYNDHGLNFFLDQQPTFAIGAAPEYRNEDEGWGIPTIAPFRGAPEFSWHLIDGLIADEFDLVTCQEMSVDHGFHRADAAILAELRGSRHPHGAADGQHGAAPVCRRRSVATASASRSAARSSRIRRT